MREKRWGWTAALFLAAALTVACADEADQGTQVTLILDFVPGGIHAGIYSAQGEGYFQEAGLEVDIQPPASAADTLRLVLAERATIGIAPIGDVASLRARGEPVRIFLALEQVPLVALISTEAIGVSSPAQLEDSTIGVTGVPSDEIVARFILESSGVDPEDTEFVTIGFDAVTNLIGRTVDAAIGFWSAEAVALEREGEEPVVFRPEDYGAPPFPELVFFAADETAEERSELLAAFSQAVARGYRFALAEPDRAIEHLASRTDGLDRGFAAAEFEQVRPYFLDEDGRFGTVDEDVFDAYLEWAAQVGIIESIPEELTTTRLLP